MARPAGIPQIEHVAANHVVITTDTGRYLQSYESIVAAYIFKPGGYVLGLNWDYSQTTMKYVGQFLHQNTATTRKQLKSGIILHDPSMN